MTDNQLMLIDERTLKDRIYTIRGQQVMLDYDLALIYGYETRYFNRQIKNNVERFDTDFMFPLTKEEMIQLSMCKNFTSIQIPGLKGGRTKPIKAFTEQGIYMLMTVLKGELAVQQSKTLIRLFKAMKDHILASQILPDEKGYLALLGKVEENSRDISEMKSEMVSRRELSEMMKLFDSQRKEEEILILGGEPYKADLAYQKIYGKAKKTAIIVDDYIGIKTLHHLTGLKQNVSVTLISDNRGNSRLTLQEYTDFLAEYPVMKGRISFLRSMNSVHDCYIFLDPS